MHPSRRRVDRRAGNVFAVAALALASCAGRDAASPERARLADTCRLDLGPRTSPLAPPSSEMPPREAKVKVTAAASRLVVDVELPTSALASELETKIGPRLAEVRNQGLGLAGHLDYSVDRGPFQVAVEGDSLVVRTDIHAHARACRGSTCYASCEPEGRATATVPLHLGPDYRFAPSRVAFAFTRGCKLRVLGGLVEVDVTGSIAPQLDPTLRRVEREIDAELPNPRVFAERLWSELGKTRELPLGRCLVTSPTGLVQGPASPLASGGAQIRLAVVAHPEIRSRCGAAEPTHALPPLVRDLALPAEDEVALALVGPLDAALEGLEGRGVFSVDDEKVRIARAVSSPWSGAARIDLGLRGDICGDVAVRAGVAWTEDGRSFRLVAPLLVDADEEARAARGHLDAPTLTRALSSIAFAPPTATDALRDLVPALARGLSDGSVDVSATVSNVRPLFVDLRGADLAAVVAIRGHVDVRTRR